MTVVRTMKRRLCSVVEQKSGNSLEKKKKEIESKPEKKKKLNRSKRKEKKKRQICNFTRGSSVQFSPTQALIQLNSYQPLFSITHPIYSKTILTNLANY